MIHPLVSIIIPVYNGSNFMKEAIDSAIAQTYDSIEIVVVNDGSNDRGKTDAIARSYGEKIVYINRSNNLGIAATLNEGIEKMTGDYFTWLSHDDLYLPQKVEEQIRFLNEIFNICKLQDHQKIALCGASETINTNGKIIRRRRMQNISHAIRSREELLLDNIKNYGIGGCTVLIPRDAFSQVGMFDPYWRTMQDAHMWFRLILNGYVFCYLGKRLVQSRAHEEETGRRLYSIFMQERSAFQEYLVDEMYSIQELHSWKFFFKVGIYQKKLLHNKASKNAFAYSKSLTNNLLFYICYLPVILYSSIFGFLRELTKRLYWKLIVKA